MTVTLLVGAPTAISRVRVTWLIIVDCLAIPMAHGWVMFGAGVTNQYNPLSDVVVWVKRASIDGMLVVKALAS